ncbi:MAG: phosphogluconate dehydrogenase C-terminal domain-containing protein [Armatimonadaceae bacterium]
MTTIALFGAGGKMGTRLTDNLMNQDEYAMRYVEVSETGIANLALRNLTPTPQAEALAEADVVILALPDRVLGKVAQEIVPQVKPGAMVMTLDPAAAHAGELPERAEISYFVTHPCHPPMWGDEEGDARRDFFGGIAAKQAIVCALMQGPEEHYEKGDLIARAMYAPVLRSHRVTVEQMAILEPTMAETITACCCTIIREALDEAVNAGVPEDAAKDFMYGHINIAMAIVLGEIGSPFSDGAKLIIEHGKQYLVKPDWKRAYLPEEVKKQVKAIVNGTLPEAE